MFVSDLAALFRHSEWADALVWRAVLALGVEDVELREKLHHVHLVQWGYLAVWREERLAPPALDAFPTLRSLHDWARRFYLELPTYLESRPQESADRELQLPWADQVAERFGAPAPVTWADTAIQVNMHSAHHRGQLNARLRGLGVEPPLTDFIAWVWMGRPVPEWPDAARV